MKLPLYKINNCFTFKMTCNKSY